MSKPVRHPSSRSLRVGALLFALASVAACATPQRGFSTSAAAPSPARWGFATLDESSRAPLRGYAQVTEPPAVESWGFTQRPAQTDASVQALR